MLPAMTYATLRLRLDGMTAGDYLAYLRDPEPPALGHSLHAVDVRADPLSDVVEAQLAWTDAPETTTAAAHIAGFPTPAEVVELDCCVLGSVDSSAKAA
jgi:hypothetical protein